ncbi:hypothetical protein JCM5350_006407 [Sporobolomyces pararoseus]
MARTMITARKSTGGMRRPRPKAKARPPQASTDSEKNGSSSTTTTANARGGKGEQEIGQPVTNQYGKRGQTNEEEEKEEEEKYDRGTIEEKLAEALKRQEKTEKRHRKLNKELGSLTDEIQKGKFEVERLETILNNMERRSRTRFG